MKAVVVMLVILSSVTFGSDPFALMDEERRAITRGDADSVSIRFSVKKDLQGVEKTVWVTEEVYLEKSRLGVRLLNEIFEEKESAFGLINHYYIGEPVLGWMVIYNDLNSKLIEIPIGIPHKSQANLAPEEIDKELFLTKAEVVAYDFLRANFPEAEKTYIAERQKELDHMEKLLRSNKAQPGGGANSDSAPVVPPSAPSE